MNLTLCSKSSQHFVISNLAKIAFVHGLTWKWLIDISHLLFFVWFDSLRPINNLSVIKGRVFLGWTSTKLGLMFLLKDTTQWRRWGSNPRPFGLESSTLPLSHCAPYPFIVYCIIVTQLIANYNFSKHTCQLNLELAGYIFLWKHCFNFSLDWGKLSQYL